MTEERAWAILQPHPQGRAACPCRSSMNQPRFKRVPKHLKPAAEQKLDDLLLRWKLAHPGRTMSQQKHASLIANATNYALNVVTMKWQRRCGLRWGAIFRAKHFLQNLQVDQFRSQPLNKRVKRLI